MCVKYFQNLTGGIGDMEQAQILNMRQCGNQWVCGPTSLISVITKFYLSIYPAAFPKQKVYAFQAHGNKYTKLQ